MDFDREYNLATDDEDWTDWSLYPENDDVDEEEEKDNDYYEDDYLEIVP
jgi:hypothetical protein